MLTRDEVLVNLTNLLETLFEASREDIHLEAKLYEDLDLDSIDAVDLAIKLQEMAGRKIPPEKFKEIRTVGDIVDQVCDLVTEGA